MTLSELDFQCSPNAMKTNKTHPKTMISRPHKKQKLGFSTEPREEIKDDDVTMAEADDGIGDHRPEMVNEQMSRKEGALAAQVGEDDPDTDQSGGLDCDEIFEYYDTANADFDREACRSDYMTRFDEDLDGQLSPDEFEHLTNALDQEPKEDL